MGSRLKMVLGSGPYKEETSYGIRRLSNHGRPIDIYLHAVSGLCLGNYKITGNELSPSGDTLMMSGFQFPGNSGGWLRDLRYKVFVL
jgi:hypothetical protein